MLLIKGKTKNKGIRYLLCAIDLFSKYAWVIPLKDKNGITFVNAIQSIFNNSKRKPNKLWVDQGSEFYNSSFKKQLKDNDIKKYSTYNEGKSVVAERFVRTCCLNSDLQTHESCIKMFIFDDLDNIVDKYNSTYHRTIKMKPIDVKSNSYAE